MDFTFYEIIKLLNDSLDVSGYLRNDSAWRIEDGKSGMHGPDPTVGTQEGLESGDYVLGRNTLQIEFLWQMNPNFSMSGIYRAFYDASIDLK